jgi:hypothetical protein|tara:strand:+ start:3697 stop:3882 length:186 start_codon:yes stop_codon:yes gene_type:complete
MNTDLTYTEKFLVQVERLRLAGEPTAEFSVHFLTQLCKELKSQDTLPAVTVSNNVDGGRFK